MYLALVYHRSITRLTTRLTSRNLLTTETPKLAAQIEADRKQIDENKETIMSQLDTINQLKIERQVRGLRIHAREVDCWICNEQI